MIKVGKDRQFQMNSGYIISLIIDDYDYESDITGIRIVTSLNSAYPVYIIKLNLRPIEVLQQKILGQNVLKLKIQHIDFDGSTELDSAYSIDLLYLSGDFDIPPSPTLLNLSESLQDLAPYTMRCVPEAAFQFMTVTQNFIFRDSKPAEIFNYIYTNAIKKFKSDTKLNIVYDVFSPYKNEKPIPQVIFPPTTVKNHYDYLLNEFGLFYNWGCIFASIAEEEENKLNINALDIGYQYESGETLFYLRQIAIDTEDSKTESYGYENFYITHPIHTKYIANTTIGNTGNNIHYIHKPIDFFARIGNANLQSNYLSIDEILMSDLSDFNKLPDFCYMNNGNIFLSNAFSTRERYEINHICHYKNNKNEGEFQDEAWLQSTVSKQIMNFSQLSCKLEKHIPIFKFSDIGKMVHFESETAEYKPFNGKYILFSSDMVFKRSKVWEMTVDVNLIRPKWSMAQDD